MQHFKKLRVWEESIQFCKEIYQITLKFPKREQMGITRQLRETALAIPSNISKGTLFRKYFSQYLRRAGRAAKECETLLILSMELGFLNKRSFEELNSHQEKISKMLSSLIKRVEETK